jgi:predicted permease
MARSIRLALRSLAKSPGFALVTVTALALGIGANTTIVSIANTLFLQPLPVRDAGRVIRVFSYRNSATSYPNVADYRAGATQTLEGLVGFSIRWFSLRASPVAQTAAQPAQPIFGELVTEDYFDLVGVPAALGRTFERQEASEQGVRLVAVLSHRAWLRRFSADPAIVGRAITINGQAFTVLGVMPPQFTGLQSPLTPEIWLPVAAERLMAPGSDLFTNRGNGRFQMVGRLRPGATLAQAQAELTAVHKATSAANGETDPSSFVTAYAARVLVPEMMLPVSMFLGLLLSLSALVLLIACLNIASLMLARSTARTGDVGICLALGASRRQLLPELLMESLLLAVAGGAAGALLAWLACRAIGTLSLPSAPVLLALHVTLDLRVLAISSLLAGGCALACGLLPALHTLRQAVLPVLHRAATATRGASAGRSRLRTMLVVGQVAAAFTLLIISALLAGSLRQAQRTDLGFDQEPVLTVPIDLGVRDATPEQRRQFFRTAMERVSAMPGVEAASLVDFVPVTMSNRTFAALKEGQPPPASGQRDGVLMAFTNTVGPGHFATLRIPLLAGRDFREADGDAERAEVAIVNETLARRLWPGESPLGKRLRSYDPRDPDTPLVEVVGVARDATYTSIGEVTKAFVYFPFDRRPPSEVTLLVRTTATASATASAAATAVAGVGATSTAAAAVAGAVAGGGPSAEAMIPMLRRAFAQIDPDLPLLDISPMRDVTSVTLLPIRVAAAVTSALALLVIGLTAIGLYGVLSFLTRMRTREIGVRMALGARRTHIALTVARQVAVWLGWGLGIGAAAGLALAPLFGSLLYGVPPADGVTFALVALLLTGIATAASAVPAWRASRVDPQIALRAE